MAGRKSRPEEVGVLSRKTKKVPTEKRQASSKGVPLDTQKLIQELEEHQVELEMQNEELRRAQRELEEAKSKYEDLISEQKRMAEEIRQSRDEVQDRSSDLLRANELFQAEISQRQVAEDSLRESEKRLRHLSYQLLNAQENERKRIARELHDSIGQSLTAIKFTLERKLSLMKKEKPPTGITLEDIVLMTQNTIQENRRIMTNLRPAVLDDLGILATLSWFLREFQNAFPHLKVEQQLAIREEEVADHLKTIIFRVLQEAMNNFSTHSKGDRVTVALRKTGRAIELMIQDNGTGFDLMQVQKGLGLNSMEERVDLSGGAFAIETTPGKGTMIRATWSL